MDVSVIYCEQKCVRCMAKIQQQYVLHQLQSIILYYMSSMNKYFKRCHSLPPVFDVKRYIKHFQKCHSILPVVDIEYIDKYLVNISFRSSLSKQATVSGFLCSYPRAKKTIEESRCLFSPFPPRIL